MFHKKSETQWILPFSGEGKCVSPTSADRQGPAGLWRLRYRHERTCECCQNMSKPVLCGLCFGEVNWSEVSQMSRVIHLKAIVAIVYNGDIIHNIYIYMYIYMIYYGYMMLHAPEMETRTRNRWGTFWSWNTVDGLLRFPLLRAFGPFPAFRKVGLEFGLVWK